MSRAPSEKLDLILVIVASMLVILGIFAAYKYAKIEHQLKLVLTREAVVTYAAANSISRQERTINGMVTFLRENYLQRRFYQDQASLDNYINDVDSFVKSVVISDKSVDGAWLILNPNLFLGVKNSKLTFQNFSFTSWYYRDNNDEIIKAPRVNIRITPENDPYYFKAITSGSMVLTDLYYDSTMKTDIFSLSSPIYLNNTLFGVTGIDISKKHILATLDSIKKAAPLCNAYLFDSKGSFVIGTTNKISTNISKYAKKIALNEKKEYGWNSVTNNELIIVKVDNNGPFILAELPLNHIFITIKFILYTLFGACIVLFVFMIILFSISRANKDQRIKKEENPLNKGIK